MMMIEDGINKELSHSQWRRLRKQDSILPQMWATKVNTRWRNRNKKWNINMSYCQQRPQRHRIIPERRHLQVGPCHRRIPFYDFALNSICKRVHYARMASRQNRRNPTFVTFMLYDHLAPHLSGSARPCERVEEKGDTSSARGRK